MVADKTRCALCGDIWFVMGRDYIRLVCHPPGKMSNDTCFISYLPMGLRINQPTFKTTSDYDESDIHWHHSILQPIA